MIIDDNRLTPLYNEAKNFINSLKLNSNIYII